MKLNEMLVRPLKEVLEACDVVSVKPITSSDGEISKLILEYVPSKNRGLKGEMF